MDMKATDIEIMSPVGSYESLMAAIQGGADAVYFGIEQLNMRSRSSNNFTIDDLIEISKICREKNIRTYITLNTIIYDSELELMRRIVDAAKENDISAIIASDISVIKSKVGKINSAFYQRNKEELESELKVFINSGGNEEESRVNNSEMSETGEIEVLRLGQNVSCRVRSVELSRGKVDLTLSS